MTLSRTLTIKSHSTKQGLWLTKCADCWGDPALQPSRLTRRTLETMRVGIPLTTLPKTFQDAVTFTRAVGIRFLWIDSLCIIQDSHEDWEDQSAKMCDIYSGSFLNIAATGAKNSWEGMFSARCAASILPLLVRLPCSAQGVKLILGRDGRDSPEYLDALDNSMWRREVEESPLCRRAWVVQERALSRRTLHFGKTQLYWECLSISACETVLNGLQNHPAYLRTHVFFKSHDPLRHGLSDTVFTLETGVHRPEPPFFSTWGRLVESFSAGGLTKESDKLVAILGIANALASQTKFEYIAGLWNYYVPVQLMWHTKQAVKRSDSFHAPSWLWASVKSRVSWHYRQLQHTCIDILEVNQAAMSSPGADFSSFESRRLRIRGDLIPGTLKVDGDGSSSRGWLTIRESSSCNDDEDESFHFRFLPDADEDNLGDVFFVPIEFRWKNTGASSNVREGLVLKPTGEKAVFRRVGFFTLFLDISNCTNVSSKRTRLMGYRRFPTAVAPLKEVDGQFYHSYEDIREARKPTNIDGGPDCELGDELDEETEIFERVPSLSGGFVFDIV